MSGVTEISFLCDKAILQTTAKAQVGRRASDFVQVGWWISAVGAC
jgi:hypothetical protein